MGDSETASVAAAAREWSFESLRLTCFPSAGIANDRDEWDRICDYDPDQEVRFPSRKEPMRYLATAEDSLGTRSLRVDHSGTRFDWFVGSIILSGPAPDEPAVGLLTDVQQRLEQFLSEWAGAEPPRAQRLGVGLILLGPEFGERSAAYAWVARFLHFLRLDPKSSDFMYQINRRRRSRSGLVDVNRLSLWSVAQMIAYDRSGRDASQLPTFRPRLELDINTAPEHSGEFDADAQAELVPELLTVAVEVAMLGDVE